LRVTSIEIFDINTEFKPEWHPVIIRINTDEGISGLGEVGLAYGTGHSAGAAMVKDIEAVWKPIEEKAFGGQAKIEEEALALFKQDPQKAREFLTKYCHGIANGAVDAYWKLADDLWTKYTNAF
jgi:L-alanine-DL-glutamate epimerase-like enolase superfamily enzyme